MNIFIVLTILFVLLTLIYVVGVTALWLNWRRIPVIFTKNGGDEAFVTVLIPVRNEAEHIEALLLDLNRQSYRNFEVRVMDDFSEDETAEIVNRLKENVDYPLYLHPLEMNDTSGTSHKKAAISQGVELANGELILCTDGDCRVSANWIPGMSEVFGQENIQFASGPVSFHKKQSLFVNWQTIEFASLVGTGGASMYMKRPNMCNGANMAFRKNAFVSVNGYEEVNHIASGDDEFLMQKINNAFSDALCFVKNPEVVVFTEAKSSLKAFFHQRRRWAGKWKHYKNWQPKVLAAGVFFYHLLLLTILGFALFGKIPFYYFLIPFLLRMAGDFLFLREVLKLFKRSLAIIPFLTLQLPYLFYVLIFGFSAHFGQYEWKGRTFKS